MPQSTAVQQRAQAQAMPMRIDQSAKKTVGAARTPGQLLSQAATMGSKASYAPPIPVPGVQNAQGQSIAPAMAPPSAGPASKVSDPYKAVIDQEKAILSDPSKDPGLAGYQRQLQTQQNQGQRQALSTLSGVKDPMAVEREMSRMNQSVRNQLNIYMAERQKQAQEAIRAAATGSAQFQLQQIEAQRQRESMAQQERIRLMELQQGQSQFNSTQAQHDDDQLFSLFTTGLGIAGGFLLGGPGGATAGGALGGTVGDWLGNLL